MSRYKSYINMGFNTELTHHPAAIISLLVPRLRPKLVESTPAGETMKARQKHEYIGNAEIRSDRGRTRYR
jgi:hypothetical protein